MVYVCMAAMAGLVFSLAGCIVIPPHGQHVSQKEVEVLVKIGASTKADVLKQFADAKGEVYFQEGRYLIVRGGHDPGGVVILVPAGYSAGILPIPFGLKRLHYWVLLEFDENEIVKRYEYEEAQDDIIVSNGPVPLGKPDIHATAFRMADIKGFSREVVS